MSGVTFLPEEFRRAEEEASAHLPTDDVGPLIDEERQISIALNPLLVGAPNDRLACGANDERFFKFGRGIDFHARLVGGGAQTVVGDDSAFLREAFHVLSFFTEEVDRNEKGKVSVAMTGCFKATIEFLLHFLPDRVAIGSDDHTAADGGMIREFRFANDVEIPLGIVLGAGSDPRAAFFGGRGRSGACGV